MSTFRFVLATLLLASPALVHAQHAPPAAPPASQREPASPALEPADDFGWLDDADLMAFGLEDDFLADGLFAGDGPMVLGDFEDLPEDMPAEGPMALNEDEGDGPGMAMGHGGPGGPGGPDAMMHGGMGHGGMGHGEMAPMHGGMGGPGGMGPGMHGRLGLRGGRGMMRGRMLHMRMAQLGLSDAQRDKLQALHEANARKAVQRRADLQLAQMDLRKLMRNDKPDQAAINAQVDRIAKLRADGVKASIDTRLQARAVLTPDQWKKLHAPPAGMGMGAPGMERGMGHGMEHEHDAAPGKGKD